MPSRYAGAGFGRNWIVDIIIFGQPHVSCNKRVRGILMFNPGRCRESFGLLTIAEDHPRTRLMTQMFDIIADL
jgi:predicted phosphodiesterase